MNNTEWLTRTEMLLGDEKLDKLRNSNVLVVGLGGVGAYAAELICRAGVGNMTIVDGDKIEESNMNRQLPALSSTIGKDKAEILSSRLKDINPELNLRVINYYITEVEIKEIIRGGYDYVVDAIDTLTPKIDLICNCVQNNIKIVSSMGAGGKLDPSKVMVDDISNTYNCKLARMLRKRLHKLKVYKGFKVVFSSEELSGKVVLTKSTNKKSNVGTISYMPPVFGCFCASVVIRDLVSVVLNNNETSVLESQTEVQNKVLSITV